MGLEALAEPLLRASLQGALAVALVWAVCRLVPRLPAALRCALWWLACLRLLVALAGTAPVPVPGLPAGGLARVITASVPLPDGLIQVMEKPRAPLAAAQAPAAPGAASVPPPVMPANGLTRLREQAGASLEASSLPAVFPVHGLEAEARAGAKDRSLRSVLAATTWIGLLMALWAAGVLVQLALAAVHLHEIRAVVRRAVRMQRPAVEELIGDLRARLGVRGEVEVLTSPEIATPQVLGVLRPRILLPAAALPRLSREELAMTLCHELVHVRRGDLWLGWVPAVAQRLFFFHPLARLAAREYALAREAACDAAVLRLMDPAPDAYGRLLLRLGVAPRLPRWAAAGAAPTFRTLKRRLEMLQQSTGRTHVRRAWWLAVAPLALVVLVPFSMQAEQEEPATAAAPAEAVAEATPATVAEAPAVATVAPVLAVTAPALASAVSAVASAESPAPVPAAAAVAAVAAVKAEPKSGFAYAFGGEDDDAFVLLYGEGITTTIGSTSDMRRAREVLGQRGPGIWFERGGKEYVIRDAATLRAAEDLFAPQAELGQRQGELGREQGELGQKQGELGRRQGELGRKQGELAARQGQLAAEQAELTARLMRADGDEREQLEKDVERLRDDMAELGRTMREGQAQAELGRRQAELGRKQAELGRKQAELGRQQAALAAKAQSELRKLLDRAIASGLAQEVE